MSLTTKQLYFHNYRQNQKGNAENIEIGLINDTIFCRESHDQEQDDTGKGKGKARATTITREGW